MKHANRPTESTRQDMGNENEHEKLNNQTKIHAESPHDSLFYLF
jgi:hypothetical protein